MWNLILMSRPRLFSTCCFKSSAVLLLENQPQRSWSRQELTRLVRSLLLHHRQLIRYQALSSNEQTLIARDAFSGSKRSGNQDSEFSLLYRHSAPSTRSVIPFTVNWSGVSQLVGTHRTNHDCRRKYAWLARHLPDLEERLLHVAKQNAFILPLIPSPLHPDERGFIEKILVELDETQHVAIRWTHTMDQQLQLLIHRHQLLKPTSTPTATDSDSDMDESTPSSSSISVLSNEDWNEIAKTLSELFPGAPVPISSRHCRLRAARLFPRSSSHESIHASQRTAFKKWTHVENQLLLGAIDQWRRAHPRAKFIKWSTVSVELPGRTPDMCRQHWLWIMKKSKTPYWSDGDETIQQCHKGQGLTQSEIDAD